MAKVNQVPGPLLTPRAYRRLRSRPRRRHSSSSSWFSAASGCWVHWADHRARLSRRSAIPCLVRARFHSHLHGGRGPITPPLRRWGGGASLEFPYRGQPGLARLYVAAAAAAVAAAIASAASAAAASTTATVTAGKAAAKAASTGRDGAEGADGRGGIRAERARAWRCEGVLAWRVGRRSEGRAIGHVGPSSGGVEKTLGTAQRAGPHR